MKNYSNNDKWASFKDRLAYVKDSIRGSYLLSALGIEVERETSKEIRGKCVIHGGDNKTAFRYNKEKNTWVCFTHKCHEEYSNDAIGLVQAVTKKNFMDSVKYIEQLTGMTGDINYSNYRRQKEIDNFIDSYDDNAIKKPKAVNDDSLKKFATLRSAYFLKQGFDSKTLDHFEIAGGWQDKHGIIRDIIPIRDIEGELVAYSLRDIRENIDYDYKYILTEGFNKDNCLYNLHNAIKYCDRVPLILVEGFKSVWRLYEYGIKNVVAVMGADVTEGQASLLMSYAEKGAVILFDNDKAGVEGTLKVCDYLESKMDVRPVYLQEVDENGKGLDPADLIKEKIYDYLDTYFIK